MIFRDLVGGGGKEKSSTVVLSRWVVGARRRDLAWSAVVVRGEVGDAGWYEDSEEDLLVEVALVVVELSSFTLVGQSYSLSLSDLP